MYRQVLSTGMRRGELLGLEWADVNLDARMLAVRRTLGRGTEGAIGEGTPKSKSSSRRISLYEATVESLRRQRKKQLACR
jgi:integrase